ncbi:methionyl-tRNA synthetase [Bradyrhizobium sp. USDA 4470]
MRYLQFLGKDNVPFHAVSFPCTLLGSGEPWKTVDVIKGVNWLTYEGGKFSTSARRGVFLDRALELLPADRWRWWLTANAPESSDADFSFARFGADVDHDLADTFGNLVQRILSFVAARYEGVVPGRADRSRPAGEVVRPAGSFAESSRGSGVARNGRRGAGDLEDGQCPSGREGAVDAHQDKSK